MNIVQAPAPDVISSMDVCRICHFSKSRLSQVLREHPAGSAHPFPAPAKIKAGGGRTINVYDRAAVKAWQQARTRPRRKAVYVLVTHYRRHGKIGMAARAAKIHPDTARRWLRDLNIPTPTERQPS
jgi:hypothetical protein